MGTSENIQAWSKTASTNASADSSINFAEGQDPGSVNNSARSVMAATKKYAEDRDGGLAAGGTGNAITLTTNQVLSAGHIAAGLTLSFRATATNTGATTLNVDSTGAVSVVTQSGAALASGAITSGGIYTVAYNANTSKWVLQTPFVPPPTGAGAPGLVLLTSGTVSSASTLDLALTSYTAYRGFKLLLSGFLPATDSVQLRARFSTDGGSNFITSGYNYICRAMPDTSVNDFGEVSGSAAFIALNTSASSFNVGNATTEGWSGEVTLLNLTSSALWSRLHYIGYYVGASATPPGIHVTGGGSLEAAQDTDAIRLYFSSGDIASGNYALYGYN